MVDKEIFEKQALIEISKEAKGVPSRLSKQFGVSRQFVHKCLNDLMTQGKISLQGRTQGTRYHLIEQKSGRDYLRDGLKEDQVWAELFAPMLADLPENVKDIWRYGVTEMVNNAVDHSESTMVSVEIRRNALYTSADIYDSGVGIFVKIQKALNLYDPREAILELAKGKFTTDPQRHSGEGIFFSSKAFDDFIIFSKRLAYSHQMRHPFGILADHGDESNGTLVRMRLANDSPRHLKSLFDEFAAPEEYTFSKTLVPVRLAQYEGEKLVSRSQAKRLTMRFEKFQQVILDFEGVAEIGQAFADELFRVFAQAHPGITLTSRNMSAAVRQMASRVGASQA